MLIGFEFGAVGQAASARSPPPAPPSREMWHVDDRARSPTSATRSRARRCASSLTASSASPKIAHETVVAGAGYALVFLGFISLVLAVINLFPFLPLDGGHVLWSVAEKVRGRRDLADGDVALQLGRDRAAAVPRAQRRQQRHQPPRRLTPRRSARRAHAHPALDERPEALGARGPEQRLELAAAQQRDLLPAAGRAEPPVAAGAARAGSQWAPGSSECGSIGNEQRRRLHEPAARRRGAAPRRTPRGAPAGRARSRSSSTRGRTRRRRTAARRRRRRARTARGSRGARRGRRR